MYFWQEDFEPTCLAKSIGEKKPTMYPECVLHSELSRVHVLHVLTLLVAPLPFVPGSLPATQSHTYTLIGSHT